MAAVSLLYDPPLPAAAAPRPPCEHATATAAPRPTAPAPNAPSRPPPAAADTAAAAAVSRPKPSLRNISSTSSNWTIRHGAAAAAVQANPVGAGLPVPAAVDRGAGPASGSGRGRMVKTDFGLSDDEGKRRDRPRDAEGPPVGTRRAAGAAGTSGAGAGAIFGSLFISTEK